jgi:hypothetical protein
MIRRVGRQEGAGQHPCDPHHVGTLKEGSQGCGDGGGAGDSGGSGSHDAGAGGCVADELEETCRGRCRQARVHEKGESTKTVCSNTAFPTLSGVFLSFADDKKASNENRAADADADDGKIMSSTSSSLDRRHFGRPNPPKETLSFFADPEENVTKM